MGDVEFSSRVSHRKERLKCGLRLEYFTIGCNVIEALVAIGAGIIASSIALIGFGLDSIVEFVSAAILTWRLIYEIRSKENVLLVEKRAVLAVGITLFALGIYIAYESGHTLWFKNKPIVSFIGISLAAVSLTVIPILGYFKRTVAKQIKSKALEADAFETIVCALSFVCPSFRSWAKRIIWLVVSGSRCSSCHASINI
ncbi:MAG: cation transporter [Thermoplasmatales archaeon]|nr:cation transporter [Thermoplasmatales archaeon]